MKQDPITAAEYANIASIARKLVADCLKSITARELETMTFKEVVEVIDIGCRIERIARVGLDLAGLLESWPTLTETTRATILAMIDMDRKNGRKTLQGLNIRRPRHCRRGVRNPKRRF